MSYIIRNGKAVRRPKLHREPKREPIKNQYHRELWIDGPVRTEAMRLAKAILIQTLEYKGFNPNTVSEAQWKLRITQLMFESSEQFYTAAKFNLGERK